MNWPFHCSILQQQKHSSWRKPQNKALHAKRTETIKVWVLFIGVSANHLNPQRGLSSSTQSDIQGQNKGGQEGTHSRAYLITRFLWLSSNFSVLCHILLQVAFELAEVALLLDQLNVVVLAVQSALMPNIVRRAYCAPSLAALEAAFMIGTPVHRHLQRQYVCFSDIMPYQS